jgi:phosphoglycerate dehydrogenase-like enzyme
MKRVLYLGPNSGLESVKSVLIGKYDVVHVTAIHDFFEILKKSYAVVDASMRFPFTREVLLEAKELKIISCATTGSSHIDKDAVEQKGLILHTLREDSTLLQNITPAAELSWALLLSCSRRLPSAIQDVINGNWRREEFPGIMLNGKTLGIIGCGRIGTWMSRYGRAFGMDIIGYDPFISEFPETIEEKSLDEVFKNSDFISIHVHLTDETRHLINLDRLKMCKPSAVLINTSRGQVINENDLLTALQEKIIDSAGLDVLSDEPEIENSILLEYARKNTNLIITPHCGGNSPDAVQKVCKRAAEKILNYSTIGR